jgi:hypothetical protein
MLFVRKNNFRKNCSFRLRHLPAIYGGRKSREFSFYRLWPNDLIHSAKAAMEGNSLSLYPRSEVRATGKQFNSSMLF